MPNLGSTTARGYGHHHQQIRNQWRPLVDAGQAYCHAHHCLMPTRHITPGTPWDMGHTPDRTAWTGPEHRRCNRTDGAHKGNARRRTRQPTSRDW